MTDRICEDAIRVLKVGFSISQPRVTSVCAHDDPPPRDPTTSVDAVRYFL
jgi:hypothetical protein